MRGSIKEIICFQTRQEKYREENSLPPKLSRGTRNRIPTKSRSICHRFTTKSEFAAQTYNNWRRKHCNIDILSRKNVVQLNQTAGSCAQKAKILIKLEFSQLWFLIFVSLLPRQPRCIRYSWPPRSQQILGETDFLSRPSSSDCTPQ